MTTHPDIDRLLDQSRKSHDPDRWCALVCAGLDEGQSLSDAITLADRIAATPGMHGPPGGVRMEKEGVPEKYSGPTLDSRGASDHMTRDQD